MEATLEKKAVSKKSFFLTKDEYYEVKNVVNFKNYNIIPNANKKEGGFWFFSK